MGLCKGCEKMEMMADRNKYVALVYTGAIFGYISDRFGDFQEAVERKDFQRAKKDLDLLEASLPKIKTDEWRGIIGKQVYELRVQFDREMRRH